MANKTIKGITIEIGGNVSPLNKALASVNTESKNIQSQLRAVNELLKFDPTNTEAIAEKQKLLAEAAENSRKKLDILRQAQEEVEAAFKRGDMGEAEYRAFQTRVTYAEAEVKKAEKAVEQFGDECKDSGKDANGAGEDSEKAGKKAKQSGDDAEKGGNGWEKFGALAAGAGKMAVAGIATIGTAAAGAAAGVWKLSKDAGTAADDLITLSNKTGVGVETLQEWEYAARFVDVEVETLTASMAKQIKSMQSAKDGSKTMVAAYDALGVSVTDASGEMRDGQTVYWELIDALGKIENETQRDAYAMQIFGRSAQELNPLIKAGGAEMQKLADEARDAGLVLSEEAVSDPAGINADGTITVSLTEQTVAAVGNVRCEVTLYGANGGTLSTVPFIVKVIPASVNPNITSSDEFIALEVALSKIDEAGEVAAAALEDATAAYDKMSEIEESVDQHTEAAQEATDSANAAATLANAKAGLADTAAGAANTAAGNANSKATLANNAANAANTAAGNADGKATLANNAATAANAAAQEANTKAGLANTAAQGAEAAKDRANAAAEQAEAIVEQAAGIVTRYGVCFGGGSNSGATVQRLYNAVGLVAGVGTDATAPQNDFDNIFPWNARRRCCGEWDENGNFVVNAYKGEPGYTEDGTNGEVWVEHSLFYFKHEYDGAEETIVISATKLAGYEPAPIFQKNGNKDAPYQKAYTPAFPMATVDGKATSRTGVFSGLYSLNTGMTAARTLGENYTTTTTAEWYTDCLYMWVEFATRNLQGVMNGATNMPYTANDTATVAETGTNRIIVSNSVANKFTIGQTIGIGTSLGSTNIANNRIVTAIETYNEANKAISFDGNAVNIAVGNIVFTLAWKNGACNSVIASSGSPVSNSDGKHNCVYRGKETPYGNSFEWISDVLFKREGAGTAESPYTYDPYFLPDPTKYTNGAITADYVKLNFTIPASDGYVKTLGIDNRFPWVRIPSAIGAGSNTYYSDYYYFPQSAVCAARVGGHWSHGSNAGPCCWLCYSAPSASNINFRARLSYHRN